MTKILNITPIEQKCEKKLIKKHLCRQQYCKIQRSFKNLL